MAMRVSKKKQERERNQDPKDKGSAYKGGGAGGEGGVKYWNWIYGVPFPRYVVEEGVNEFDIIPFFVKNENTPSVLAGECIVGSEDEGLDWNLDITVHKDMGSMNLPIVCTDQLDGGSWNSTCPIDKLRWANREEQGGNNADKKSAKYKKEFKDLNARRRFIIFLRPKTGENAGKVCWRDFPYNGEGVGFGGMLAKQASIKESMKKEVIDFTTPELEGNTIQFYATADPDTKNKKGWFTYSNIDFIPRETPVDEALVRSMPDPFDFVVSLDDDEIETFLATDEVPQKYIDAYANSNPNSGNSDAESTKKESKTESKPEKEKEESKPEPEKEDEKQEESKSDNSDCPDGYSYGNIRDADSNLCQNKDCEQRKQCRKASRG